MKQETRDDTVKLIAAAMEVLKAHAVKHYTSCIKTRNPGHASSLWKFCCDPEVAIWAAHATSGSQPVLSDFWSIVGFRQDAAQWIKDSYRDFRTLMPSVLASTFYFDSDMVPKIDLQYRTDFANHIALKF